MYLKIKIKLKLKFIINFKLISKSNYHIMKEKQRSKNYYDNDIKNSTNKILPLDSSLKIQDEEEKNNDLSNSYINIIWIIIIILIIFF